VSCRSPELSPRFWVGNPAISGRNRRRPNERRARSCALMALHSLDNITTVVDWSRSRLTSTIAYFHIRRFAGRRMTRCTLERGAGRPEGTTRPAARRTRGKANRSGSARAAGQSARLRDQRVPTAQTPRHCLREELGRTGDRTSHEWMGVNRPEIRSLPVGNPAPPE